MSFSAARQCDGFHNHEIGGDEEVWKMPSFEILQRLSGPSVVLIVFPERGVKETRIDEDHMSS